MKLKHKSFQPKSARQDLPIVLITLPEVKIRDLSVSNLKSLKHLQDEKRFHEGPHPRENYANFKFRCGESSHPLAIM